MIGLTTEGYAVLLFQRCKGNCRELPRELVIPILLGPFALHMLARSAMKRAGGEVLDRATVINTMTQAFCHGVMPAER